MSVCFFMSLCLCVSLSEYLCVFVIVCACFNFRSDATKMRHLINILKVRLVCQCVFFMSLCLCVSVCLCVFVCVSVFFLSLRVLASTLDRTPSI